MCGIVGIVGGQAVAADIVDALRRLEYRGYDSAGVATIHQGQLLRRRAEGKLKNLSAALSDDPLPGGTGIGHTRWATHGKPTEANAHPHSNGRVAVVHNGIIENFRELRESLTGDGAAFESDTDTEVVVHLVDRWLKKGKAPAEAARLAIRELEGTFAIGILFASDENLIVGARRGSPLAVGHGDGVMYLGSDALALSVFTNQVTYLDDGDWVEVRKDGAIIRDLDGKAVTRKKVTSAHAGGMIEKGNHRHFMSKEVFEQPEVVGYTLGHYLDLLAGSVKMQSLPFDPAKLTKLTIVACGTAYYAGVTGKYWIEQLARIPVEADVASEFRYREPPLDKGGVTLVVSQSGETADTLAALRYAKSQGQVTIAIVNVPESTIAREADLVLPTNAGPEIGVASTKAFTCQLSVLAALAIKLAQARGTMDAQAIAAHVQALAEVPRRINDVLALNDLIKAVAQDVAKARDVLFLGRGNLYPLALEGALKLKEISYIHAEGYAAGEMKHGPIALIDENVPVVVLAPESRLFEKTFSNLQEVHARGGQILLIGDAPAVSKAKTEARWQITMPAAEEFIQPLLYAVPVQLLAYHAAVAKGTDVDQPRNLAKSVTVE